jgi:hypothetical protein
VVTEDGQRLQIGAESDGRVAQAGLCTTCDYRRSIVSGRGSTFVLCERWRTDPRYPRYPVLPVVRCAGFTERASMDPEGAPSG